MLKKPYYGNSDRLAIMDTIPSILLGITMVSLLACFLLSREFIQTSGKREELLQVFSPEQQGTKRSKTILIITYVVLTLMITLGLSAVLLSALA